MTSRSSSRADHSATHLRVGTITRPHGVRGELKVRLHFEGSTALSSVTHIVIEPAKGEAKLCEIESVRGSAKGPILALVGVDTHEQAEAMRNSEIWVERGQLDELEPGEYYLVDLVGCGVFFEDTKIAEVVGVRPDPSVDTMLLKMNDKSSAEVPIVDAWVGDVDISNKRVVLLNEDGLIR